MKRLQSSLKGNFTSFLFHRKDERFIKVAIGIVATGFTQRSYPAVNQSFLKEEVLF
jgi:hypothetical protein